MAKVIITSKGLKEYRDDEYGYHRTDGPALISKSGAKWWFVDDVQHNEGNPSTILSNGIVIWILHGEMNRADGPSRDGPNGLKKWRIYGRKIWPTLL